MSYKISPFTGNLDYYEYPTVIDGGVVPTAFSPTDIPGCVLWLRSDLGITKDGSNIVSSWADQSGNGNDFTIPGTNTGPLWLENQLNGYASLSFDGITDGLYHLGLNLVQPVDIYVVMKQKVHSHGCSPYGFYWYFDDEGNSPNHDGIRMAQIGTSPNLAIDSSKPYDGIFECDTLNQLSLNTFGLAQALFNGNSSLTRVNGGSANTGVVDGTVGTSSRGWGIGGVYRDWGIFGTKEIVSNINMELVEVLIYDSALSNANRLLVETYLNTRYAIY